MLCDDQDLCMNHEPLLIYWGGLVKLCGMNEETDQRVILDADFATKSHQRARSRGPMARRLTTNQKILGSIPSVIISFCL